MKICICTTPIRPIPTTFPPLGSMAIIQSLRRCGVDAEFYNIDYFRPGLEEIESYFSINQYDLVGISTVVSTAYAYTKKLSSMIRKVSPKSTLILGGNMAASAEIILRKTEVDFCVIGDGEFVVRDLFEYLKANHGVRDDNKLEKILGIAYLDSSDRFMFTGYGRRPSSAEIEYADYTILEKDGSIDHFIYERSHDMHEGVSAIFTQNYERAKLTGGKSAHVTIAKGCVARCTFCHRWEKGYRPRAVGDVIEHVTMLRDSYGVGTVVVADENFGADRKLTRELVIELGKLGVGWIVAGVRARTVNLDDLRLWAENGCMTAYFGIESGSTKILEIMEKQATVQENLDALRWTSEAGLGTTIQLVLGMPGEDDVTVDETIKFLQEASHFLLDWKIKAPSETISINYAQALPGTPLYEFARENGYIGKTVDEEEDYLLKISDTDAYSEDHFLNYTGLPLLKVLMWRPLILAEVDAYHLRINIGISKVSLVFITKYYLQVAIYRLGNGLWNDSPSKGGESMGNGGFFNINNGIKFAPLLLNSVTRCVFYPTLAVAVAFLRGRSLSHTFGLLFEHLFWSLGLLKIHRYELSAKSLRKVISINKNSTEAETEEDGMLPLRLGR